MRVLIAALLLPISTPAFADNIADCEVVLMEKIKQEANEGVTEIASFRPATDFIADCRNRHTFHDLAKFRQHKNRPHDNLF